MFGKFRHSRETACHSVEKYTLKRAMDYFVDMSNAPYVMQDSDIIKKDVDNFLGLIKEKYSDELDIIFSYNMVLAIK